MNRRRIASVAFLVVLILVTLLLQDIQGFIVPNNNSIHTTTTTTTEFRAATTSNDNVLLTKTGADLKAWGKGYSNCPKELEPTILSCPLPNDFPVGTYYRNGHGRFVADDGQLVVHPFDGDGMMTAITLDPSRNRLLFRNKYIDTQAYRNDKRTGQMSQRGLFGTRKSGGFWANVGRMDYKNVGNTNVLWANDKVYALWEGGRPHVLDPLTLTNLRGAGQVDDLNGLLSNEKDTFSAHPRYDSQKDVWVNFGVQFDPATGYSRIRLLELDATTLELTTNNQKKNRRECFVKTKGPRLLHDFIVTEHYIIFNINETTMNNRKALKALFGLSGFASTIEVPEDADQTSIVLIPRSIMDDDNDDDDDDNDVDLMEDERIKIIPVDNHFNFHFGNAFEDGEGKLIFDTVSSSKIDLDMSSKNGRPIWEEDHVFDNVYPTSLVRYTLDLDTCSLAAPPQILTKNAPEFPSIPKDYSTQKLRYLYPVAAHDDANFDDGSTNAISSSSSSIAGSGPAGSIMKVDAEHPEDNEIYSFPSNEFPGEVAFCRKVNGKATNEDAGYLVVQVVVVDGTQKRTDFCIFDVEGKGALEKGPMTRIELPTFIPHGLHGTFVEGVTFDFNDYEES